MAKKIVLVIDDDRSVLDSLADTLRGNFEAVSAANRAETWTHFTKPTNAGKTLTASDPLTSSHEAAFAPGWPDTTRYENRRSCGAAA
jgi:hypothetical protein